MMPVPYVGVVADTINASIYFCEGNYTMAGLNISTAAATLGTGMPVAKWASNGLKAVGASAKTAEKIGCKIATAAVKAPYAGAAVASAVEAYNCYDKGDYLGMTMNLVSMGTYGFRGATSGKFCFTEGTQIVVGMEYDVDGNFVSYVTANIEDIKVGDLVYSYDTGTGEVSLKEVTSTSALRSDHINFLTILDEDGNEQVIETTDTHPFWVVTDEPDLERAARELADGFYHENIEPGLNGFWVEAKDLRVGDVFLGANGELSMLTNAVRVEQSGGIAVFNFTVEGNHNYFILAKEYEYGQTSILVHNACTNPNGKKGGIPHQNKTADVLKDLEKKSGYEIVTEYKILTPRGKKPFRVVDIAVIKNGKLVAVHQIGKTLKDGLKPVARERAALKDLREVLKSLGAKRIFHSYN